MKQFEDYLKESKSKPKEWEIIIRCNQYAADELLPLLKELKSMTGKGCSRTIKIEDYDGNNSFGIDGDGPSTISEIITKTNKC